ncbi:MAG: potassium channel protein [Terriglobia bacterium]|jgi:voltage-gated potassium channel
MSLRRRLEFSLFLLLAIVMIAAAGYRFFGGPSVTNLDAIYMAVITISTVGYHEVIDTSANPSLRIFNMFVILFGTGVVLFVFSASTAFIVEGELKDIFRRRKMLKQIRELKDHFIVCGAGEVGQHVVKELMKTRNLFVVIDHDEARIEKMHQLGDFPMLKGDAMDEELLLSAGLANAKGLATVLPEDKDNLMITVTARQLNPSLRIVARVAEARMADKLIRAGASSAVSPNTIGGLRVASELVRPHVVGFLDMMLKEETKTLRVEEISVGQGSPWVGKTIHATELHRRFEVLALALRRLDGKVHYNPHGETILAVGDVLVVMGDVDMIWKARESAGESIPTRTG